MAESKDRVLYQLAALRVKEGSSEATPKTWGFGYRQFIIYIIGLKMCRLFLLLFYPELLTLIWRGPLTCKAEGFSLKVDGY
jgi:hypothetical protein